jgi:hypothetical protein
MRTAPRVLLTLLLVTFCAPPALSAQVPASIVGTVTDSTGAVVPGATLTVVNVETGFTRTVVTDDRGWYRVANLPLGDYEIRAEVPGFRTAVRRGVQLSVGIEVTVDLTLELGEVAEDVVVQGTTPLVETTRSVLGGVVEGSQITNLPLSGRSFTDLALLQPGVLWSSTAEGGFFQGFGLKISISGSRQTQVNYTLDGSDIQDNYGQVGSVSGRMLGVDAVREFRVVTSPFSAEYVRASGGEVQIATRSGTNDLHGAMFYFLRNSALDARNFFDRDPARPEERSDPPPFMMHQFGGSAGGPIVQRRTFFFGAYEALHERLTRTQTSLVPRDHVHQGFARAATGALQFFGVQPDVAPYLALYPLPNGTIHPDDTGDFIWENKTATSENYAMGRVDHQLSDRHSFYGRYTIDDGRRTNPSNLGMSEREDRNRTQYTSLSLSSTVSSQSLNALQISYNRSGHFSEDFALDPRLGSLISFHPDDIPPLLRAFSPGSSVTTLQAESSLPLKAIYNVYQVKDDFSFQLQRHGLRFGLNLQQFRYNYDFPFQRQPGGYVFSQLRDFLAESVNTFTSVFEGSPARSLKWWNAGFYLQDDWQALRRLTLNLGLRYEFMTVPKERHGRTAMLRDQLNPNATLDDIVIGDPLFLNPSLKNFGPRVGFAWDVTGDGKTSARGGFGVFYDLIQQRLFWNAFNRTPPFFAWGTARARDVGRIDFPNAYETQLDLLAGSVAMETMQFDIDQQTALQYALNVQRELTPGLVVDLGYSGSRNYNYAGLQDINQRVPEVLPDGRLFFGPNAPIFNPRMERIRTRRSDGDAWYNSMTIGVRQRYREGLQYQIAYTWSKSIDTGSNVQGSSDFGNDGGDLYRQPPPPFIEEYRLLNRGLSAFDVRHNVVLNGSYEVPARLSGVAHAFFGGWSINGILRLASGAPFSPASGSRASAGRDVAFWGQVQGPAPDLVPGRDSNSISPQNPNQYFDPTVFTLSEPGFFGNLGRNTMTGPGIATVDFSLFKRHQMAALGEQARVEFRAEFFNLFNRPNFGLPSTALFEPATLQLSPVAGRITSTSTRSRQIQFGLKLMF